MPLTKQKKHDVVSEVTAAVKEAAGIVFIAFDGLTMPEVNELRGKLFEAGISMRVMPKRLLKIALQNQNIGFDPRSQAGQVAIIWGADPVAPAQILHTFAKKNEHIKLTAGVLEGNILSHKQVIALAKLPSKQQLLGMLVGVLSGPIRGLATVLNGVQRQTVYVLTAIKDKQATVQP